MSHFVVLVIGENVEDQLAEYDENLEVDGYWTIEAKQPSDYWAFAGWVEERKLSPDATMDQVLATMRKEWTDENFNNYRIADGVLERFSHYNPDSKWDWYVYGGRWENVLLLKDGTRADAAEIHEIDLEGMRRQAAEKAEQEYDEFRKVVDKTGVPPRFAKFKEDWEDVREARTAFNALPSVVALSAKRMMPWFDDVHDVFCLGEPNPRAAYIERAVGSIIPAYAVVRDGEWIAQGRMGWWGMSDDDLTDVEWAAQVNALVASLTPDTRITIIDAHI